MIAAARAEPDLARHILTMLTLTCRSMATFNRERQFLITRAGIPEQFLPDHRRPRRSHVTVAAGRSTSLEVEQAHRTRVRNHATTGDPARIRS
jgi:hypothetical protein